MKTKRQPWPIYEFRPLPDFFAGEFRRYNGGAWTVDDGEHDVAFIGMARSDQGWNYSCCLYVDLPHYRNIVCSWRGDGRTIQPLHPKANPWHYALRAKSKTWGDAWGRDLHLNRSAGSEGMSKMASENGCANGRHVEFHADDKHIAAGLLRERETGKPFAWPRNMKCMYCGETPPILVASRPAAGEAEGK